MVTREEIRLAYLLLLAREPEDEGCYVHHGWHEDVASLRTCLIQSTEGMARLRLDLRELRSEDAFQFFRPQVVFIHLEKVGGTSLHESLVTQFSPDRVSPPHLNCIPDCTMAELNDYDLVSGHFSYQEAMALPRSRKTFIIMFREPFARLVSFYRFHRAHPERLRCDLMVDLAKALSPADFFRDERMRASPRINNAYLQCLTGCPGRQGLVEPILMNEALDIAYHRLGTMDAIGLTERMADTIQLINATAGFSISAETGRANATADLHKLQPGFSAVAPIEPSPELREAIFPLIEHDLKIYAKASALFQGRLATLTESEARPAGPPQGRSSMIAAPLHVLRTRAARARAAMLARRGGEPDDPRRR